MASRVDLTQDLFHCTICYHEFDNEQRKAKLLPCHHTFCSHCLSSLINGILLKCPLCSDVSSVTNVNTLKSNHYLAQFADVLKSMSSMSASQSFTPVPEINEFCAKHGNTEKFFWCKTCACTVCIHCMAIDHKVDQGHQVTDMTEATENLRRQMLNTLSLVNEKIAGLRDKRNEVGTMQMVSVVDATEALLNVTSGPSAAILKMVNDATLNPKKFTTKYNASSAFLNQGIYGLDQAHKELREVLSYFLSMEKFVEQKLTEAQVQKESKIVVGFLHPGTHFDYGKMYCIRCGKMCQYPEALGKGKSNPYGVPVVLNHCSQCSITMLQF